ncbi:MAG: molybdopterin molybdotransferase MoeA [Synergistaceae bacterium]|nr:molybdopterin molybdotransferase MoeA [Synergistaceae bacterium]
MGSVLNTLISREEAILRVTEVLGFPWRAKRESVNLLDSWGYKLAYDIKAVCRSPQWARSTRDGYAVRSADLYGASRSFPVFLNCIDEVKMGSVPSCKIKHETCAAIHTGGILPEGADSVLMLEDAERASEFIEVYDAVQFGENIIQAGEDYKAGDLLLHSGDRLDFASIGILASMGFASVDVFKLKIGVLSTGDEIIDFNEPLKEEDGKIRDINSWTVSALLKRKGYLVQQFGIVKDDIELIESVVSEMLKACDVVILSGGASASVRDHTADVLSKLSDPGIIVHGIRLSPGKPTIISGDKHNFRLAIGLPGHPLSCLAVMYAVVLPLLSAMLNGEPREQFRKIILPMERDVYGHTGTEELIPAKLSREGKVIPLPSKSGYIAAFRESSGFIRLGENVETIRRGEDAEVLLW